MVKLLGNFGSGTSSSTYSNRLRRDGEVPFIEACTSAGYEMDLLVAADGVADYTAFH